MTQPPGNKKPTAKHGQEEVPSSQLPTVDGKGFVEDNAREKTVITRVATVKPEDEPKDPCLVMIYGSDLGKRFDIAEGIYFIGRGESSDIQVDEEEVSRKHCELRCHNKVVTLEDLGSTNGTFVNEQLISGQTLRDADQVKVGRTIFKFLDTGNIETAYHQEIYNLSTTDGLTQVHNKRYLLENLDREISRVHRYKRDLSLIILDIDHFKRVNDIFGHLAGDHVLRHMSQVIRNNIRREDMMARFGGEEFVVILPEVNAAGAQTCAEKIRKLVEETEFTYEGARLPVTVSIGVARVTDEVADSMALIRQADAKLYEAKRTGRNRVCGTAEFTPVEEPELTFES